MLLRRISLIRNRGGQREVRGLFFTYGGLTLVFLLLLVLLVPVAGYIYGRARAGSDEAKRALETQRLMYLSLRERHNTLLTGVSKSQGNVASPRDAGAPGEGQKQLHGYLRSYATDEFLMGNFEKCLSACQRLLAEKDLGEAARREAFLVKVFCLVHLGRWDDALAAATAALEEFPDGYPFLQAKGDILLKKGDFRRAAPLIERIFRENAGPATLFSRANLSWGLARHEKAIQDFREVLSCGVPILEKAAANNLALLYAEGLGDRENALFYLAMLQRLAPVGFRTDRTAGRVLLLAGDYARAEERLLKCYSRNPRDAEVLLDLALLYEKSGKKALSREYLQEALTADPGCRDRFQALRGAWIFALAGRLPANRATAAAGAAAEAARRHLDAAYRAVRSKRPREAAEELAKALRLAGEDAGVLLFAATYANAAGNAAAAEGFYLRVLDVEPKDLGALRGLAGTCLRAGRFERAGQWAARGLEIDGRDTLLLSISATAHFGRRRYARALAGAREYLAAGGAHTSHLHYMLATCRRAAGDGAAAVAAHYEKALQLDPDNIAVTNDYIGYLAAVGDAEKGAGLAERLLSLSGRAAFALDTAGFAHYKAGNLPKARALLEEALRKDPSHPEILLHGALVYRKLGQMEKSARLLDEALLRAGKNPGLARRITDEYENG